MKNFMILIFRNVAYKIIMSKSLLSKNDDTIHFLQFLEI